MLERRYRVRYQLVANFPPSSVLCLVMICIRLLVQPTRESQYEYALYMCYSLKSLTHSQTTLSPSYLIRSRLILPYHFPHTVCEIGVNSTAQRVVSYSLIQQRATFNEVASKWMAVHKSVPQVSPCTWTPHLQQRDLL